MSRPPGSAGIFICSCRVLTTYIKIWTAPPYTPPLKRTEILKKLCMYHHLNKNVYAGYIDQEFQDLHRDLFLPTVIL